MGMRELLFDPGVASVDVDSVDRIIKHRELLLRKRMIREVFFEIYALLGDAEAKYFSLGKGKKIEIGSGSSLLKTVMPDVEVTDVVPYEGLDRVVDAMDMPYEDGSLKTIFGIHCFHHLSDPYKFLSEIERVCSRGGGAILVDPYFGPLASLVFERLFSNEHFDKLGPAVTEHGGPMSDANQALSYVVFRREIGTFVQKFPNLELVAMEPIGNYVRYLISGGVNFRQLLPDLSIPALKLLESALWPLRHTFALHHMSVVRKR
jgi:SAM-dependent methyltransferase